MKAKLFKSALVGACLVAGCQQVPSTTSVSGDEAAALNSTAVSARYQTMAAATATTSTAAMLTAKTVTCSSTRNDYFRLAYATDGKTTSAWAPAASDTAPSLTFDLGGCFDLTGFAIKSSGGATVD